MYFLLHFSLLLMILFGFRFFWITHVRQNEAMDFACLACEAAVYALLVTAAKCIRFFIGKKRYEKNPVDRRKNTLFRE